MNRELTKREKTLLLVLVVLVLVLGYCKLFLEPIDRQITSFRTNTDIEQAELTPTVSVWPSWSRCSRPLPPSRPPARSVPFPSTTTTRP